MKNLPICYTTINEPANTSRKCELANTDECPLYSKKFKKLAEPPCCFAIFIPTRFTTEAEGNRQKAARKYIEECMSG